MMIHMARMGILTVLVLTVVSLAWSETVTYSFEANTEGFTMLSGKGTLAQGTNAPLAGVGSLRVTVDGAATEVRLASPAFEVMPWTIYRVADIRAVPIGMEVRALAQFADGDKWRDVTLTIDGDGWALGTLPSTQRARLVYIVRTTEKAAERTLQLDAITIAVKDAVVKVHGNNLFPDPSLEAAETVPPPGWESWVNKPEVTELGTREAHAGKQYYHVAGNTVYLVLPLVPVQPNRLYRIRYWVRGEGSVSFGLHKLAPRTPKAPSPVNTVRIGWAPATVDTLVLQPDTWQQVELWAVSDSDAVRWLNPYVVMKGKCALDIDDLEAITMEETATKTP